MENAIACPRVSGPPDARYLADALARNGRQFDEHASLHYAPCCDGRTGAEVTRIANGSGTGYVLKAIPMQRGFAEGMGHEGEGRFWLEGLTRELPGDLRNPTLDVARHPERGQWWLLMEDVSGGILSQTQWTEGHTRRLFEAVAALHARHWGAGTDSGAGSLAGTTAVFVETALHAATGTASAAWVERASREFQVPVRMMPTFLEALGPDDADFYIDLCRHWRDIVAALERFPQTLVHGDLRYANLAMCEDRVVLFDWEFFARAPAAVDLTWHWFFVSWAYPPDAARSPDAGLWLRGAYLEKLEDLLDASVDRKAFCASWDLGWLRMFCQLGYLLTEDLTAPEVTNGEVGRALNRCRLAVANARRIADRHAW